MKWPFGMDPLVEKAIPSGTAEPEAWLLELFGSTPSAAGPSVTPASAMRCSTVYAATRLISEVCSGLPLHVYLRTDDGSRERQRDHVADRLLNGFANEWTTGVELRRAMLVSMLLHGNGFARVIRVRRDTRELQFVPASALTVEHSDAGEPSYKIALKNGGTDVVSWRDMVHISTFDGKAPIHHGKDAIGLALALEGLVADLAKNGNRPSGVMYYRQPLNAEKAKKLSDKWDAAQAGDRRGRVAMIGGEGKFEKIDFSLVDADTLKNREHQVAEVCRYYNINPLVLGALLNGTFNNTEQAGILLLLHCMAPILRNFEGAVARALLTKEERAAGFYVEHRTEAITRTDLKSQNEALRQSVGGPWMSADEARALSNMSSIGQDTLYPPQGTNPDTSKNPGEGA